MRTPEEILTLFHWSVDTEHDLRIINQIQKEAWNEAIEVVHKHPKVKYLPTMNGMKIQIFAEDLLNLKK